jgi:CheY-like chemotaxis protein
LINRGIRFEEIMKVLIVEDQALIALALTEAVEHVGHEVIGPTTTSVEAIELARRLSPDLAFVDVDLERDLAGFEVARELSARSIPVIFTTGRPALARNAGCGIGLLAKPYSPTDAANAVSSVVEHSQGREVTRALPASLELFAPRRSKRTPNESHRPILLVEDHPKDIELSLAALESAHIPNPIHIVRDGQEALDRLLPLDGSEAKDLPALVLLDLKMPRMDGWDVLRKIKEEPQLRAVPVVVFTSSNEECDVRRSYDYGANAFVPKPRDFSEFSHKLQTVARFWAHRNVPPPR